MEIIKKILLGIVFLIMVVTIIGATAVNVDNSAEAMTIDARCTAGGCFWNESRGGTSGLDCTANDVTLGDENNTCTTAHSNTVYPLEGLFNSGGVIILTFMGLALLLSVGIGMKMFKKN